MMNNENKISKETRLFGYIGEHAGASSFSAKLNKLFKQNGDDVMIIPMNIREDDLYFTVTNMKKSHVNGAVISSEYVAQMPDMMDEMSSIAARSGMCDIVYKENESLRGDIFTVRVLTEYLKDLYASKIAIIGINPYAKAFSFLACGFEVSYFHDNLEALMAFTQEVEISHADINRIAVDMPVDLSGFDAVLDFSDFETLSMIEKLPKNSFDMKNTKQFSALRQRASELESAYTSYDDMLDKLTQKAYEEIKRSK
ncbi:MULTISPECIES: hypothetical protein [Sulfurimonas]|uniref:hypothetical protein n=1 Tax=Sulfurimonas TaxID=202746 RepID=UPI0012657656|nr:hypothetical protein [Sulfurimonas indica]